LTYANLWAEKRQVPPHLPQKLFLLW
jgi:hypothetical protein